MVYLVVFYPLARGHLDQVTKPVKDVSISGLDSSVRFLGFSPVSGRARDSSFRFPYIPPICSTLTLIPPIYSPLGLDSLLLGLDSSVFLTENIGIRLVFSGAGLEGFLST